MRINHVIYPLHITSLYYLNLRVDKLWTKTNDELIYFCRSYNRQFHLSNHVSHSHLIEPPIILHVISITLEASGDKALSNVTKDGVSRDWRKREARREEEQEEEKEEQEEEKI